MTALCRLTPFARPALSHHYPATPNLGDMTTLPERISAGEIEAPDVLTGGTPCQAFSAVKRGETKKCDVTGKTVLTWWPV